MSKLFQHIKAKETTEKVANNIPFKMVSVDRGCWTERDRSTVYRVDVTLGASVNISDNMTYSEKVDTLALSKVQIYRQLAEEIFGEFRLPLLEARNALLYKQNPEQAAKLIDEVLKNMFEV